jgi:hypothetical protein
LNIFNNIRQILIDKKLVIFSEPKSFPPSLTNVERAFVHEMCQDFGLKSKSFGKGDDRFLTVFKKDADEHSIILGNKHSKLKLSSGSSQKIQQFLNECPLVQKEIELMALYTNSGSSGTERSEKSNSKKLKLYTHPAERLVNPIFCLLILDTPEHDDSENRSPELA